MSNISKLVLRPRGAYLLGWYLARLEWALSAGVTSPLALATQMESLTQFAEIHLFDDIGREASEWSNFLKSQAVPALPADTISNLKDSRSRWHALALERLEGLFMATPGTAVNPKSLMNGVGGFLAGEEIELLEEIEHYDLEEGCACLLVGAPTASERMALRAAESVLRRWHELRTGKRVKRQNWGRILEQLVREYPEGNRPKELSLLGYLRERRNELDHPDKISSISEAETTLMVVFRLFRDLQPVLNDLFFMAGEDLNDEPEE